MPAKGSRATGGAAKSQTTPSDEAKAGADTGKGAFPSRAQSAAAKNAAAGGPTPKAGKGGKST